MWWRTGRPALRASIPLKTAARLLTTTSGRPLFSDGVPPMNRTIRVAGITLMALSALTMATGAEDKAKSIEGAWTQVEQKNGDAD